MDQPSVECQDLLIPSDWMHVYLEQTLVYSSIRVKIYVQQKSCVSAFTNVVFRFSKAIITIAQILICREDSFFKSNHNIFFLLFLFCVQCIKACESPDFDFMKCTRNCVSRFSLSDSDYNQFSNLNTFECHYSVNFTLEIQQLNKDRSHLYIANLGQLSISLLLFSVMLKLTRPLSLAPALFTFHFLSAKKVTITIIIFLV